MPIALLHPRKLIFLSCWLFCCLSFFPSTVQATTTVVSWEKYHGRTWSPEEIVEELAMLAQLAQKAQQSDNAKDLFRAHLFRARINKARDYKAYHADIAQLDSLMKNVPATIGDSMAVEYCMVKAEGLLLERFVPEAYQLLVYAREISGRHDWPAQQGRVRDYFAYYYLFTAEYKKSRDIKRQILQEMEEQGIQDSTAWLNAMFGLGVVESLSQDFEASNILLEKVYALKDPEAEPLATLHYRMGHNYSKLEDYAQGEFHLKKALEIESRQVSNSDFYDVIQTSLARMYSDKGDYELSTFYHQQSIPRFDSLKLFQSLFYAHINVLLNQLRARGDSLGLASLESFRIAQDSLRNREAMALEKQYRVQYETFEKEATIRELELARKRDLAQKWALAGLIGLALVLIFFVAYRFRTRQRITQQALALEQLEKQRLTEELDHKKASLREQIDLAQQKEQIIGQLRHEMASHQVLDGIISSFEQAYLKDLNWDHIILQFDVIEPGFVHELRGKSERITLNDTKMAILIRLGYSTASIADILNISREGVRKARQRLKDKVGEAFLQNISPSRAGT